MMQYSRDLKGHLASLFLNENINLGKKYVFDIKRTSKEVYDHARRALYNAGIVDLASRSDRSPPGSPLKPADGGLNCSSCEGLRCQQARALQEELRKLKEAMLCMVCCGEEINSAFCPCGHTVCCEGCAAQLQVRGLSRPAAPWRPHLPLQIPGSEHLLGPRAWLASAQASNAPLQLGRGFGFGGLWAHRGLAYCFQPRELSAPRLSTLRPHTHS